MKIQALLLLPLVGAFQSSLSPSYKTQGVSLLAQNADNDFDGRRSFLSSAGVAFLATLAPQAANAGIDPNALKTLSVEGDAAGSATRMRQIEALKNPESDNVDKPWEDLSR